MDYDAIIVGARVAGAATAMLLARSGHRVLLLDRALMPSDTVSTHAILRSGVLQLHRWGLLERVAAAGTPPVRDVTLGFGPDRIPVRLSSAGGVDALYAPRRYLLDDLLGEAAVAAGAELITGAPVTGIIRDSARAVGGVVIGRGPHRLEVTARLVVGADGAHSRVARWVGAAAYRRHEPLNAVHYAYYEGIDASRFWFLFNPGVNAGLIPTNDGAVLAYVGRPTRQAPAFHADPDGEFTRLLELAGADMAGMVREGTRVTLYRGTPGLAGHVRRPWGAGWALVGDAGYTKDPISAHGISDAFRDAELCARAADAWLRGEADAATAFGAYHRVRDRLSLGMYDQATALAAYRWDAAEASARMRAISAIVVEECDAIAALPAWRGVPEPALA